MSSVARGAADEGTSVPRMRVIVWVAAAGAVSHIAMAATHLNEPFFLTVMLLMTAACVPCLVSLWRHRSGGALRMVFGMSIAMVLVHVAWLMLPGMNHAHHAASGGSAGAGAVTAASGHAWLVLLSTSLELLTAALCALRIRRELRDEEASKTLGRFS